MDGDAALSAGDTHLLFVVGALEITVILVLHPGAEVFQLALNGTEPLEKFGVFRPAALHLTGEAAEQGNEHQNQGDPVQNAPAREDGHNIQNEVHHRHEVVQLIRTVTAGHEPLKPLRDFFHEA